MNTETKVSHKSNDLTSILVNHLGKSMNLARIKFIGLMIVALCKVQTVNYEKLASAFETSVDTLSNLRRIQRFMASYKLDFDLIARLIHHFLPLQEKYDLAIDRTCWDFGVIEINLLVLSILYKGTAIPILFSSCKGKGNSSWQQRAELIDRFFLLFGKKSISSLVADREFIGSEWMAYLKSRKIRFYLRIKAYYMVRTRSGNKIRIERLFDFLKVNQQYCFKRVFFQKGVKCYLSGTRFINNKGKPELAVIASMDFDEQAMEIYKTRWAIECAFRAFKTSGFNLEDTHLSDRFRVEKLVAIVAIAHAWAFVVGDFIKEKIKPIRILKNGRRAYSIGKYGLNYIARFLFKNKRKETDFDPINFLSCT